MIKIIGFGKKRAGMSHDESVKYHVEKHAPFGKKVAAHLGMKKYIGNYPDYAFTFDGKGLPDVPSDICAHEWFTDEFWSRLETWRTTDPDGIEVTKDEARFCDRSTGYMLMYQ